MKLGTRCAVVGVSVVVMAALWGCGGDEATSPSGGSGTTSGTTTASSSGSTGSTGSGAGGVGGAGGGATTSTGSGGASTTGTGTGGSGCPDITCGGTPCPGALWPEVDGCPSCACSAPLEMIVGGQARPTQYVQLGVTASAFIGGIDRWVFDFVWGYDDPGAADEAEDVAITVRLMRTDPMFEPALANRTYFHPADSSNPLEVLPGTYTLYGFGISTSQLTPVYGFFSIRRVGDTFEGFVSLDNTTEGGGPGTVHVAGPFSAPVPP